MEEQKTINNFSDLIDATQIAVQIFKTNAIWWRGQPIDKPLIPTVFRNWDPRINFENTLRFSFEVKARSRSSNCPGPADRAGWLFLMQHHGLNTRLLDWTTSILIAAYFSGNKDSGENGVIYAIDPFELNNKFHYGQTIYAGEHVDIKELFDRPFLPTGNLMDKIAAIDPPQDNIRMLLQHSTFTIHGSQKPLEDYEEKEKFLMKFIIPEGFKKILIVILGRLGINESTIFPELEHLANYINTNK